MSLLSFLVYCFLQLLTKQLINISSVAYIVYLHGIFIIIYFIDYSKTFCTKRNIA